ncbi:hypothetical protein ACE1OA_05205 [Streptomyces sp. JL2001]|uniref:hypothetical protein n=1 Tax=Streptomyces sp. JL2001 TaxID=3342488 RepID=UPI003D805254
MDDQHGGPTAMLGYSRWSPLLRGNAIGAPDGLDHLVLVWPQWLSLSESRDDGARQCAATAVWSSGGVAWR